MNYYAAGDIEKVWAEFWEPLVVVDGEVRLDHIKRELYDYWVLLEEVPKVYMYITDGRVSKPNTAAFHIIAAHDEAVMKAHDEGSASRD